MVKLKIPPIMRDIITDEGYLDRCLELGAKGLGSTAPNPLVGCVLVSGGRIIGEGYHREYGGAHAEAHAIASVRNPELLTSSTLYVNLEPCAHHGKTPPCSDLILEKGIPRVVIGTRDPNRAVSGKGIHRLRSHGVEVKVGIRKEECLELNRRFFTYHKKGRPYIILKWAETKDGFIDHERAPASHGSINWITGSRERQLVHKWRSEEQAILVGTRTALTDDPELTVREWNGPQPLRLAIDRRGGLPASLKLMDGKARTVIFSEVDILASEHIRTVKIRAGADLTEAILEYLFEHEILSMIVEGGRKTLDGFIRRNLWDEARVFTGFKVFLKGTRAPALTADVFSQHRMADSILSIYRNQAMIPEFE
jgi:diaminohydroxyphosphoribosylaminopyrimidine deaminase/5-amino-6-(5-phosphoribosylamino)uracil reductase